MAVIALALALCLACFANGEPLLIGAFNIQIFGQAKMDKPDVVQVLIEIVQRYDVLVIQEIRDSAQTALPELIGLVNEVSFHNYDFVESPRTGRTSSKEQYGYVFRTSSVRVIDEYQYPDNKDIFEREPYTVRFERIGNTGVQNQFSYVSLHAKPDDAVAEIDALVEVYDVVAGKYGENVLLAGDFNADCSYVCSSCWDQIDLWTDSRFSWLISSSADTTMSSTDCAYDRIVVAGASMTRNSHGASVFYFENYYNLSIEEAKDVSDHRPVEFFLD